MAVLYKDPEEAWEKQDGAPQGPDFDFTIPSSRKGRRPYRLVRHSGMGRILHVPACEAWQFDHKHCRHVQEAVYRSEQPGAAFYEDVTRMLGESAWWASPEAARALIAAVIRRRDVARTQMEVNADHSARVAAGAETDWSCFTTPEVTR